jgi:hypothetical protein
MVANGFGVKQNNVFDFKKGNAAHLLRKNAVKLELVQQKLHSILELNPSGSYQGHLAMHLYFVDCLEYLVAKYLLAFWFLFECLRKMS